MDENDNDVNHLEVIEDAEEALSLRDLPLQDNDDNNNDDNDNDDVNDISNKNFPISLSSKNDPPEFFEFLADHLTSDNMCPADDIIFCGKLVPFKHQPTIPSSGHNSDIRSSLLLQDKRIESLFRRRSESLSELQSFRTMMSRSGSTKVMRNSRSLDSRKLHRLSSSSANTSPESDIERNPSVKSVGRTDSASSRKSSSTVKPRWFVFMFGTVKFPPEMELKDIKNRQFRRNQSVMFPATSDGGSTFPVNRSSTVGKSSWKFLKALSCKDHSSVGVMTPFCIPPQA